MIDQKIKNNIAFDKICNYPIFNTFVRLFYYPIFFIEQFTIFYRKILILIKVYVHIIIFFFQRKISLKK